jgi:hypothetical protein
MFEPLSKDIPLFETFVKYKATVFGEYIASIIKGDEPTKINVIIKKIHTEDVFEELIKLGYTNVKWKNNNILQYTSFTELLPVEVTMQNELDEILTDNDAITDHDQQSINRFIYKYDVLTDKYCICNS